MENFLVRRVEDPPLAGRIENLQTDIQPNSTQKPTNKRLS